MTRCQFCNKKEWDIILRAEGYILEHINKFLICRYCYEKHILKPMKIKTWLIYKQEAAQADISFCEKCISMTKTINEKCGKCGKNKGKEAKE